MLQSQLYIYKIFKAFAIAHQDIQRIGFEFEEQIDQFVSAEQSYPVLFIVPLPNPFLGKGLVNYGFRVYTLDIIQADRSNVVNLINKTELILRDFVTFFHRDGDAPIYLEQEPTSIPVNNYTTDNCAGHYIDIVVQSKDDFACGIPFSGQPVFSGGTSDIVFKEFLTCETLGGCTVITDIENQLQLFYIAVNYTIVEEFEYVAPEPFKINTITNPSGLTVIITNNGSPYTLGEPINEFDNLKVNVDSIGFIKLNCELI